MSNLVHLLVSLSTCLTKSPVTSLKLDCMEGKPSLLCLPEQYSKYDLPFKGQNFIKIGQYKTLKNIL